MPLKIRKGNDKCGNQTSFFSYSHIDPPPNFQFWGRNLASVTHSMRGLQLQLSISLIMPGANMSHPHSSAISASTSLSNILP